MARLRSTVGRHLHRSVVFNIVSALMVRVSGLAVNVVAIPVAIGSLGQVRFGFYLALFGLMQWIPTWTYGIYQGLAKEIASEGIDGLDLPHVVGAALLVACAGTAVTSLIAEIALNVWMADLASYVDLNLRREIQTAGLLLIVTFFVIGVLQTLEGVQIGLLRQWVTNLARLIGSIFTVAALVIIPVFWSAIGAFVLAINGGAVLCFMINAVAVPNTVRPSVNDVTDLRFIKGITASGFNFFLMDVSNLSQIYLSVFLLSTIVGASAVVDFGIYARLTGLLWSLSAVLIVPIWPWLLSSPDRAYHKRVVTIFGVFLIGTGVLAGAILMVFGNLIVFTWTGQRVASQLLAVGFGGYAILSMWTQYWCTLLLGQGRAAFVGRVCLAQSLLALSVGTLSSFQFGAVGMAAGLVFGSLLTSVWIFPLAVVRHSSPNLPTTKKCRIRTE